MHTVTHTHTHTHTHTRTRTRTRTRTHRTCHASTHLHDRFRLGRLQAARALPRRGFDHVQDGLLRRERTHALVWDTIRARACRVQGAAGATCLGTGGVYTVGALSTRSGSSVSMVVTRLVRY